jgi:hypothetical protein
MTENANPILTARGIDASPPWIVPILTFIPAKSLP